jgi:hypothetical protein
MHACMMHLHITLNLLCCFSACCLSAAASAVLLLLLCSADVSVGICCDSRWQHQLTSKRATQHKTQAIGCIDWSLLLTNPYVCVCVIIYRSCRVHHWLC